MWGSHPAGRQLERRSGRRRVEEEDSSWQLPNRYLENSLIYVFDKITDPVLIGEGPEDGRLLGADGTFVALWRLSKEVEYRLYEGARHRQRHMAGTSILNPCRGVRIRSASDCVGQGQWTLAWTERCVLRRCWRRLG